MPRFEQFGQSTNPEMSQDSEGSEESREQFGDRALQAAQEVYDEEVKALETKVSVYDNLETIGYTLAVPGSLYIIAKFLGVDVEQMTGLNISESADAAIRLSGLLSVCGAGIAGVVQENFEKKLSYLREKFGVLSKQGNLETE